MDRNERAVSEDDYHAAVTTGNNSPWPGVNLLEGLWAAGRKALTSLLEEVTDLPAKRATMAGNVFMHMWNLFREGHNAILLDIAIELDRESLALRPPGHRYRATSCVNLAVSLRERYEQTSDAALLDESIELEREALVLQPPGHSDRSTVCVNLALSLHVRYGQTGDAALLDEAIELAREALVLQPPGHPDRAGSFGNLAVFLCGCYQQTGDAALLDEAIELAREALVLQPPGHPDRAGSCGSLAASLRVRYRQTGDTALLDEAIKLDREALVLRPPGHHQRVRSCNNLAVSLYERCGLTGNAALLDEAIKLDRETLALRPLGHPDHASSCGSLAASLHKRYQQTGNAELLNEAIELHRKALALQPPGHPNRVIRCTTLAVALCARYKQTGDAVLLDEAIEACIHGLEHSLPSSSWCPLTQLSRMHLIRDSPHYSVSKALEYIQQSFQHEANSIHKFVPGICDTAALIWDNPGVWTPPITALLVDVYAKMVDRLPLVAGFVLDTPSRLQYLKPTRQIGSDAFVAALLAKQPVTALTLIDRAHGVVWSQALRQRDPQMEGAPASLSAELEGLLGAIATRAPVDPAPLPDQHSTEDIRHRQDTRIQIILRQIRAMPGLSHFMLGSTYETLREVARDHPVVVLVAARDHAFALIMSGAGENEPPHALDLTLTSDDLLSLRGSAEQAGLRSRADTRDGNTDARVRVQISKMNVNHQPLRVLADIWRKIVKPVIDHLQLEKATGRSRPRLHWCANGDFVFLPIHAAGIYTGPQASRVHCSDFVVSSYTPTISALLRAQKSATPIRSADVSMLLVGEDCATNLNMGKLWNVRKELECVESIATTKQFGRTVESISSAATVERVTDRIKPANFVHLACHGIQDSTNALESGFYLHDSMLTISKLIDLRLDQPWFAYLSACETAKGDAKQPDQVMHLAAAMLFAGFKSVVATMWIMSDEDGPAMAEWFYEELMSNETVDADAVAYALDSAVQKLREKEPSPKRWAQFIHLGA